MLQAKLSLEVAAGQGNKKLTRGENETTIRIHKISRIPKDIKLEFQEATSNIIKHHQTGHFSSVLGKKWQPSSNIQWPLPLSCSRPWREAGAWKSSGRSSSLRSCQGVASGKHTKNDGKWPKQWIDPWDMELMGRSLAAGKTGWTRHKSQASPIRIAINHANVDDLWHVKELMFMDHLSKPRYHPKRLPVAGKSHSFLAHDVIYPWKTMVMSRCQQPSQLYLSAYLYPISRVTCHWTGTHVDSPEADWASPRVETSACSPPSTRSSVGDSLGRLPRKLVGHV